MTLHTIAARHAQVIVDAAAHAGVDGGVLLAAAGVDPISLRGPEARLPLAAQERLWATAVRLTVDEAFAVRIGASLAPGRYGVFEPLIHSSATVGDAMNRMLRLERLSVDGALTTLVTSGRDVVISHGPRLAGIPCSPYGIELTLASVVSLARSLTGASITPRAVRLQRAAPPDPSVHDQVFGARVAFGSADDALVLDRRTLDLPIRTADPGLADTLDRYFTQQLAKMPPQDGEALTPRVVAWLRHAVSGGAADIAAATRALAISERTLQRQLQAEATTFGALADMVRREIALVHARDARMSLDVVAVLAGFSEKSAFYRAFRRWTGFTPAAYRRQQQAT